MHMTFKFKISCITFICKIQLSAGEGESFGHMKVFSHLVQAN